MTEPLALGTTLVAVVVVGLIFFSRLRLRTVALVTCGVVAVVTGALILFSHLLDKSFEARNGPPHVFGVSGHRSFLSEGLAVEKARAALALDGCGHDWEPVPDGRTSAPDGRRDVWLLRNERNPNAGWLILTNAAGERFHVEIRLGDERLTCRRIAVKSTVRSAAIRIRTPRRGVPETCACTGGVAFWHPSGMRAHPRRPTGGLARLRPPATVFHPCGMSAGEGVRGAAGREACACTGRAAFWHPSGMRAHPIVQPGVSLRFDPRLLSFIPAG
jgi:hypothetical protein